jgi:hypothetical protein
MGDPASFGHEQREADHRQARRGADGGSGARAEDRSPNGEHPRQPLLRSGGAWRRASGERAGRACESRRVCACGAWRSACRGGSCASFGCSAFGCSAFGCSAFGCSAFGCYAFSFRGCTRARGRWTCARHVRCPRTASSSWAVLERRASAAPSPRAFARSRRGRRLPPAARAPDGCAPSARWIARADGRRRRGEAPPSARGRRLSPAASASDGRSPAARRIACTCIPARA